MPSLHSLERDDSTPCLSETAASPPKSPTSYLDTTLENPSIPHGLARPHIPSNSPSLHLPQPHSRIVTRRFVYTLITTTLYASQLITTRKNCRKLDLRPPPPAISGRKCKLYGVDSVVASGRNLPTIRLRLNGTVWHMDLW